MANLLKTAFPHLSDNQIKITVTGLFNLDQDIPQFKDHLRDFLVQIREFTGRKLTPALLFFLYMFRLQMWIFFRIGHPKSNLFLLFLILFKFIDFPLKTCFFHLGWYFLENKRPLQDPRICWFYCDLHIQFIFFLKKTRFILNFLFFRYCRKTINLNLAFRDISVDFLKAVPIRSKLFLDTQMYFYLLIRKRASWSH